VNWRSWELPTGKQAIIPDDISIVFPDDAGLTAEQRQATAYIPWNDHYLSLVPTPFQAFFTSVLPYLGSRTTNVHTALSVSQLAYLIERSDEQPDTRIAYLATILHDTGWSKVSLQGIADSLSYKGVTLSQSSQLPKQQHVLIGAALAFDILDDFDFKDQPVSETAKRHISQIIRQHDYDAPWDKGRYPELSAETKIVCDADRLWSYTHENFWQDTIRKDVSAREYVTTLSQAIDGYFITPQARDRARQLIDERQYEIKHYQS
jgi:HD domain